MSALLEKAIEEISKLPESEQDAFGEWLLSELASERQWAQSFADSEELLAQLAALACFLTQLLCW